MSENTPNVRILLCSVCDYPFSDKHHIYPQAKDATGFFADYKTALCPNHHRMAHVLYRLIDSQMSDERIRVFANEHFDAEFRSKAMPGLIAAYQDASVHAAVIDEGVSIEYKGEITEVRSQWFEDEDYGLFEIDIQGEALFNKIASLDTGDGFSIDEFKAAIAPYIGNGITIKQGVKSSVDLTTIKEHPAGDESRLIETPKRKDN